MQITCTDQYDLLQSDLNSVYHWASDNNIMFNASKFKYVSFLIDYTLLSYNVYIVIWSFRKKNTDPIHILMKIYMCTKMQEIQIF